MKRFVSMLIAALLLFSLGSCKRRPLTVADYSVNVVINIDKDIVNYRVSHDPELMRVAFFDHEDGHLMTQAFLPPEGGKVNVIPGRTYDVLVYNFDTEVTLIKDENSFSKIIATTNTISDAFKSKLKSRGTKSPTKNTVSSADDVKSPDDAKSDTKDDDDETIVYDPDHLYVGRLNTVEMPARSVDSPEVTLTVDCETVVQTWILEVDKIKGAEYIGSISAVITGLSEFNKISTGLRSKDYASVFFDIQSIGKDGILTTKFNTFGENPEVTEPQILSLVITDTGGKGYIFNVDVSSQFPDNKEQIIRVKTDDIVIPEPEKKGGGGIAPSVDEWKDIVSEIII